LCDKGRMKDQNNNQNNNQNQNTNLNQHPNFDPALKATPEEWAEAERERKAAKHLADEYLPDPYEEDGTKRIWHDRRRGKIGRLPGGLRLEVNQRLVREEPASQILGWLNSLPEVAAALRPYFGKVEVTAQNLSQWRGVGFREWLMREDREVRTRELAEHALRVGAQEGVDLGRAAAALLFSQMLALMEPMQMLIRQLEEGGHTEERLSGLAKNVVQVAQCLNLVRQGEQEAERLRLKAEQVELGRQRVALAREQFLLRREQWRHKVAGELVKKLDEVWAKDLALDKDKDNKAKITAVGKHLWGEEFEVERPDNELSEEEKAAKYKLAAVNEDKFWAKTKAEQKAKEEAYMEEQRKRKAAGLPPPPNWFGEWRC
jgi:hypothetical protein